MIKSLVNPPGLLLREVQNGIRGFSAMAERLASQDQASTNQPQSASPDMERENFAATGELIGARFQTAISPEVTTSLWQRGYAVVDNIFGQNLCKDMKKAIEALKDSQLLHLNNTHFVNGQSRSMLPKSNVYEADLMEKKTFAASPLFATLQTDTSLRVMLSLFLPQLRLDSQAIKLQYNQGNGGCFPIHFDNDESVDSRRVSAIVYLNENWKKEDGGELRLYPTLDQHLDIAPKNDRLVLFASCRMPHRVLPSTAERYCFTIWLSQTQKTQKLPTPLPVLLTNLQKGRILKENAFKEPEMWKAIVKLRRRDEWRKSLEDSHPANPDLQEVLNRADRECNIISDALKKALPDENLDDIEQFCKTKSHLRMAWF